MNDYSRHYAILRVTQDIDWQALRARYKRLIGQWHPDRFPAEGTGRERAIAEEHSKEITFAYQALERYYRDHGVLPPLDPPAGGQASAVPADGHDASAGAHHAARPASRPQPRPAKEAPGRRVHVLFTLSALIVVTYTAYRLFDEEMRDRDAPAASEAPAEEVSAPEPAPESQRETGGISAGSTLGEVYAIQGIPTRAEGEIWHYGKSSIRFSQGKVVSWVQDPANPLRIARDQPLELREGSFDVGSTKDEVRSVQGTPVTESETVWDYGPSRVYFERNRVVRWETSPLQPLRVPR